MEPAVQPKKIVQLSEQVFNPVKIPIIINNQIYLMVQQDIRHIEETRHISYAKVGQDGQFFPIDGTSLNHTILPVPDGSLNHSTFPVPIMNTPFPATSAPPQCRNQNFVQDVMNCTRNTVNASPGFPFHYSEGTSTSDINIPRNCCRQPNHCGGPPVECANKSCSAKEVICRGMNTDMPISRDDDDSYFEEELSALMKMKLKKINDCSSV